MYEFARTEFEKLYDSTLDVLNKKETVVNGVVRVDWEKVADGVPCRISQKQLQPTFESDKPQMQYQLKLFCPPEIEILAGSKITVTNTHGESRNYVRSSEGFNSYRTHQEVLIVREVVA